jgi:hypothetical protein
MPLGKSPDAGPYQPRCAFNWMWPNSRCRQEAMRVLQEHGMYQLGRYGRWAVKVTDQGIAQSILDGLCAGASFKE